MGSIMPPAGIPLSGSSSIAGHLVPATTNVYDLGSSSSTLYWRAVYTVSCNFPGGFSLSANLVAGESNSTMILRGAIAAGSAGPDIALRAVNDRTAGKIVSIQDNNGSAELAYYTWSGRHGYGLGGTALVAGDFVCSAGFGSTASVGTITATDTGGVFTVTSAGTGQGANPTVTLTFKDGTWTTAPTKISVCRAGGSQRTIPMEATTITATTLVLSFLGTPVNAETYIVRFTVAG
jgi:hypothetical protein